MNGSTSTSKSVFARRLWSWMILCFLVAYIDARDVFRDALLPRASPSLSSLWGVLLPLEGRSSISESCHRSTNQSTSLSALQESIIPRQQVSVGYVRLATVNRNNRQSAIFYSNSSVYTSSLLEQDSIETLAIASDVLLVMIEKHDQNDIQWKNLMGTLLDSVANGAKRRRDAGFPKLAILVVVVETHDANPTTNVALGSLWKEQILSEFELLTPDLVASIDIATEATAEAVYQDVISDLPSDGMVTNVEEYRLIIENVYQSLTKKECHVVFEMAESSFFESSRNLRNMENETSKINGQDYASALVRSEHSKTQSTDHGIEDLIDDDSSDVNQTLLLDAKRALQNLELQLEEVWLNSEGQVPLLHFGSLADDILDKLTRAVEHASLSLQMTVLQQMAAKLKALYNNQLLSLREHYGRKYEAVLEEYPDNNQIQVDTITRISEGFRAAAQHAIPQLCREGQLLVDADFSYVSTLQGLLSDMMEATSMRKAVDDDDDEDDDAFNVNEAESTSPPKWYKKLAARILMVGVNYIQGWLAWQGIKRAAEQRDKDMPKFPLF